MKRLPILVLFILGCSIPLAEGWNLKVEPGVYPGETVTWGLETRPVNQEDLTLVQEIHAAELSAIAFQRRGTQMNPYTKICEKGEISIYQRDDYTEYFADASRQELVYKGCGPDSGEQEYWRTVCVKEEQADALVDNKCFRYSSPANFHCRSGRLGYARSVGQPFCLDWADIPDPRLPCVSEVGLIYIGGEWMKLCVKIQNSSIRELVHVAQFIDR